MFAAKIKRGQAFPWEHEARECPLGRSRQMDRSARYAGKGSGSHTRGRMTADPFSFCQLAGEIILLEIGNPFPDNQPAAELGNIPIPSSVPRAPALPQVMEVKKEHREKKNVQTDVKHVLETVEAAHELDDGSLHPLRTQRLIRNKEGEVPVVIFPAQDAFRKDPVLFSEPSVQLRPGKRDGQNNLDGVKFGFLDEFPKILGPFLGRHAKLNPLCHGIAENEHAVDPKTRLLVQAR